MKRIVTLCFTAVLAATLFSGCNAETTPEEPLAQVPALAISSEAMAVEAAIDQIGNVSMQSRTVIDAARTMYDGSTSDVQAEVRNLDALEAAEEIYRNGRDAQGKSFFDLDRMPNRYETAFMLIRMLDKELEAVNGDWAMSFTDVEKWTVPYVGYVCANGLMDGISETAFDGNGTVTAPEYMTLILKALGYENFTQETVWELSDAHGLTKGQYAADSTEFAPGDLEKIFLKACEVRYVMANATAWGLPADIRWIAAPKTVKELDNNISFSFLIGNYALNFTNLSEMTEYSKDYSIIPIRNAADPRELCHTIRERYNEITAVYPELVGGLSNGDRTIDLSPEGAYILDFPNRSLTGEALYVQQLAALEVAKHINSELHEQGKVKPGMTQLEIAQVYYDYLQNLKTLPGDGVKATAEGRCVEFDSPYAILVNRKGDCVGRAATYNLLMHLEGIDSQGLTGGVINAGRDEGHIISRVILDGEVYYCDWFPMNGQPLTSEIDSWFKSERTRN